jgi:protease I
MAKIGVLIGNLFEDVEYTKPAEAFKNAGNELVHVGIKAGETVKGKKEGTPVKIDEAAKDASVAEFDAIFIPGGYSPDQLRVDDNVVDFTRKFVESGKPVFVICHGPQLLITAQVLKGCKITGYKSIIQDIKDAGAEFVDQQVVEDQNIISSRNPNDIPVFIDACLKRLKKWSKAA